MTDMFLKPYREFDDFYVIDYRKMVRDMSELYCSKSWWSKKNKSINKAVIHHTAGNLQEFPSGLFRSVRYCVQHRGWASIPYNYYIPFREFLYHGKPCIFYIVDKWDLSWHTKGANFDGVAAVFQGNFQLYEPSDSQKFLFDCLIHFLANEHGLDDNQFYTHSDFTKPECPGPWLESGVREVNAEFERFSGPLDE